MFCAPRPRPDPASFHRVGHTWSFVVAGESRLLPGSFGVADGATGDSTGLGASRGGPGFDDGAGGASD